jgi:CDGSH-type Zn-finger protein
MSNTPTNNSVRIAVNGPALLRGDIELVGADGATERGEGYALCRCGQTSNKPFCDGTHRTCGYVDAAVIGTFKPKEPPAGQTHLRAKVVVNGPIVLEGPFRMQDGSGATIYVGGGGSLCRCGQSANKPFCDGAHKSCGWQDAGLLGA